MDSYIENVRKWWNENADSEWYKSLRTDEKIKRIVDDPWSAFHPGVREVLERGIPDLAGKRVLLPSSGDNHAAFAFSILGANVVSSDISPGSWKMRRKLPVGWGWTWNLSRMTPCL